MFEISRRDLVLGSTGAALVFGLKGPVSFIGAAQAQRAADSLKYKVGEIEVFSLHDGSIERTVAEGMVKNASLDDVKKALTAAGIGPDKINNPFTVTAIRTGGKVVLFDTGFGGNGPATVGKLADNMKAAGLDPAAVATVVISHFHPDHISGLWIKETSEQVYPNAQILMPEVELELLVRPLDEERRIRVRDRPVPLEREPGGDADHQLLADADVEHARMRRHLGDADVGEDHGDARVVLQRLRREPVEAGAHRHRGTSATTRWGRSCKPAPNASSSASWSWPSTTAALQRSSAKRCAIPPGQR